MDVEKITFYFEDPRSFFSVEDRFQTFTLEALLDVFIREDATDEDDEEG